MGIPAFGYDWDLSDSKKSGQLDWTRVASLLTETQAQPQWNEAFWRPLRSVLIPKV